MSGEKDATIAKMENNINQLTYQKDSKEQMLVEINNRYVGVITEHKNIVENCKNLEKTIKKMETKID